MAGFAAFDPRRIRVKKPEVKTGCVTCKVRRVKCDEAKPDCNRCIKFGTKCEGYAKETDLSPRSRLRTSPTRHTLAILPTPYKPRFENEEEHRYFNVFVERTAPSLAGFYDTELWCRLILQACESQISVRNTAIAVAALDQTLDIAQTTQYRPSFDFTWSPTDRGVGHVRDSYKYALQQYGKAIKVMREEVAAGQQDLRTILMSCLLAVCFELYHGNHVSVLSQAASGLRLLASAPQQEKPLSTVPAGCAWQILPPSDSDAIEDELVQIFVRLDFQARSFLDEDPTREHNLRRAAICKKYQHIPKRFVSLSETRTYWELSLRPLMYYMTVDQSYEDAEQIALEENHDVVGNFNGHLLHVISSSEVESSLEEPLNYLFISQFNCSKKNFLLALLERDRETVKRWASAFAPLFEHSRTVEGSASFVSASILQLRYKTTMIALLSSPLDGELQYDKFTNLFQEVIGLSEIIINHEDFQRRDNKAIFTFDSCIVAPLTIVAIKCRVGFLRRQAISLLLARPRREGIWDSVVVGKYASAIIELEEAGLGEREYIPEHRRVNAVGMSFDLQQRVGLLQYTQGCSQEVHGRDITW